MCSCSRVSPVYLCPSVFSRSRSTVLLPPLELDSEMVPPVSRYSAGVATLPPSVVSIAFASSDMLGSTVVAPPPTRLVYLFRLAVLLSVPSVSVPSVSVLLCVVVAIGDAVAIDGAVVAAATSLASAYVVTTVVWILLELLAELLPSVDLCGVANDVQIYDGLG
uniref:Zinc transporter ZIP12 n=1 Tax=Lygus hesperus TaxID=30085 RepID=A0A0A9Z1X5_LYGHE